MNDAEQVLVTLRNLKTIRTRSQHLLQFARNNQSEYFIIHEDHLDAAAEFVIKVMLENYPDLDIPWHSRWRHFDAHQVRRVSNLCLDQLKAEERGKIMVELAIVSVLLDAGAGQHWRYHEAETGLYFSRSEGLAVASLALYEHGVLSFNEADPLRVDAANLLTRSVGDLQRSFQVQADNPLVGLEGRVALLNHLGREILAHPEFFGREGRLGGFFDYLSSLAQAKTIAASSVFAAVLQALGPIWPARLEFAGSPLGDVWVHSALDNGELGSSFVPFHKLSQWLTYSLLEPMASCGFQVTGIEELTGLPEYRNGGLFIDSGVLELKNPQLLGQTFKPEEEMIVEWRALTVALLDELAELIRKKLGRTKEQLPLASILQGGTWEAGRRIARELRHDGEPPLLLRSDGTVF